MALMKGTRLKEVLEMWVESNIKGEGRVVVVRSLGLND